MTELLTAAQMRAIEQAAIDSGEVTGLELMERAGRGVVEAIFEEWPELAKTDHRAVVLCGPGNNGGDGFVVARLLKEWGWEVEVFLYGDADKLPADARVNYERWQILGVVESFGGDKPLFEKHPDLFIDALFGIGLSRELSGQILEMAQDFEDGSPGWREVAIDIPSGLNSDSGRPMGAAIPTDLTVTFHNEKLGHRLNHAHSYCGKITVKDIGLTSKNKLNLPDTISKVLATPNQSEAWLVEWTRQIPNKFKVDAYKFSYGHALILSGPATRTGAARIAANGAMRIGAGLVTVGAPKDALAEHAAQLNAVMLLQVDGSWDFSRIIKDKRINALCIGPALGLTNDRAKMLRAVLKAKRATVVDADALTLISKSKRLFNLLHDKCVLTPHAGEFARVFPDIAEKLNAPATKGPAYSKVDATREAAKRAGCVVLFKGADTVISAPDGQCAINSAHYERSAPWLATAGSGDVLAGFITGLLARGFAPMQAAETGAWLHVECALKFGPGLIAEDLPEQLPKVFQDLGL